MKALKLTFALTLTLGTPALAADPPSAAPAAPASAAPAATTAPTADSSPATDPEKLVCKRVIQTGTTIPKRVCKTMAQIESERRDAINLRDRFKTYR